MKRVIIFSLIALLVGSLNVSAEKKKEKREFRYEIVAMGTGSQGTALIKVYSYAKKEKDAVACLCRNVRGGEKKSHQRYKKVSPRFQVSLHLFDRFGLWRQNYTFFIK